MYSFRMPFHFFTVICTLLAITSRSAAATNFEDCATNIATLQNALYDDDGYNTLRLQEVFFPANTRTSRFIQVTYAFFNEDRELDGCNVTYVWAIGQILFIHPPAIFKYTSLYFNFPNNDLDDLSIQLPYECRALVNSSRDGECFCNDTFSPKLEILTQQVSVKEAIEKTNFAISAFLVHFVHM